MRNSQTALKNINEYIAGFPNDVQEILETIKKSCITQALFLTRLTVSSYGQFLTESSEVRIVVGDSGSTETGLLHNRAPDEHSLLQLIQ